MNDDLPLNYQRLEMALQPPSKDEHYDRYARAQRGSHDTAAKRLAKRKVTDARLLALLEEL